MITRLGAMSWVSRDTVRMPKVLDLDLDFFVWPIVHDREELDDRLTPFDYETQSEDQVRQFLESNCGLSRDAPIIGRQIVHHVEAFATWGHWQSAGILTTPFTVVHADAHSDLGSGLLTNHRRSSKLSYWRCLSPEGPPQGLEPTR